jgi:hypothetical protein
MVLFFVNGLPKVCTTAITRNYWLGEIDSTDILTGTLTVTLSIIQETIY